MHIRQPCARIVWIGLAIAACTSACTTLKPAVPQGGVLFQDNFSRPNSGWDRYRDEIYEADYAEGVYRMLVITPETLVWSLPGVDLTDARITVEARAVAGSSNNLFGTLCRYQDADNYVFFLASSDGYVGIGRYRNGQRELLTDKSLLPTEGVKPGGELNVLTATCSGTSLTLEINGQIVAQAEDAESLSGDLGLLIGTYDQGGTEVEFDNFSATQP